MINIEDLSFSYKRNNLILDKISCEMKDGRIYGLLGKNGVGKSTLLHLIAGLLVPQKGKIAVDAHDSEKREVELLQNMFFLNEELPTYKLTIGDYEKYNSVFYPHFSKEDFVSYLREFEIEDMSQKINKLSMGTRKKVYIAFGLASNTKLILLDEPTNGLDIPSKASFRRIATKAMNDERTMLISTHQARDLQNVLDDIIILDKTKVLLNRSGEEITKKLWFGIQNSVSAKEKLLYQEDSVAGQAVVKLNKEGVECNLDVEMLFNAVFQNKELFAQLFNEENKEE